jgi:formylglycine-generating enzyme required for sulfatase activity
MTGMEFVLLPAGSFDMGLARTPGDLRPAPVRSVRLTRPLYVGRFEVTQGQWRRVMGSDPAQFPACGESCPVETVSWYDAREFLRRLAAADAGERFRLPTEAEWEYACRAGAGGRYGSGVDTLTAERANYDARIPFDGVVGDGFVGRPLPVGSFPPNAWGLYDLAGNVWEWTSDEYCPYAAGPVTDPVGRCGTDTVAIRGGSWAFSANAARCGRRYTHHRGDSGYSLGFRVVREIPRP